MYNGIGLQTARGSGTNGYVQANKFFVRPRSNTNAAPSGDPYSSGSSGGGMSKANKDILEHDRKRQIQLRLLVLQETLADQGYTESEISAKLDDAQRSIEADQSSSAATASSKRFSDTQTHQVAARKERELEIFRAALGIKGVEAPEHEIEEETQQEKEHILGIEEGEIENEEHLKDTFQQEGYENRLLNETRENIKKGNQTVEDHITVKGSKKEREEKASRSELRTYDKDKRTGYRNTSDSDNSGKHDVGRKKQHGKSTAGYDSADDDVNVDIKKSTKKDSEKLMKGYKYHKTDGSDSDTIRSKGIARKEEKDAKKRKRHDTDSYSDMEVAKYKKKQSGKGRSRSRRSHSDDSESDGDRRRKSRRADRVEHGKPSIRHDRVSDSDVEDAEYKKKQSGKQQAKSRMSHSDNSDSDTKCKRKNRRAEMIEHEKSSRRHDSQKKNGMNEKKDRRPVSEDEQSETDSQEKNRRKVLEKNREISRRHNKSRSEKEINIKDEKHEKRSIIKSGADGDSKHVRSENALKEILEFSRKKKRHGTDDESSGSDRDNKTMKRTDLKWHTTKREFDSASDDSDSHSSDFSSSSSDSDSEDSSDYSSSSDSEDSSDYSKEKHSRREARANSERIISKPARQEKSVAEEGFSAKTDRKYDTGKNKIANDNVGIVGKSKHLGSSEKADREDVIETKRNIKDVYGHKSEEVGRKKEAEGIADVRDSKSRSSWAKEERVKETDARAYGNYSRTTEDHRREDHSRLNKRDEQKEYFNEGKYGRKSHAADEKHYDDSMRSESKHGGRSHTEDERSYDDSKRIEGKHRRSSHVEDERSYNESKRSRYEDPRPHSNRDRCEYNDDEGSDRQHRRR